MDTDVLNRRLEQLCSTAMAQARAAVAAAPQGAWIAGSEWQVRDVFQRLARECYEEIVQDRAGQHPSASQASFSPGGRRDPAEQRGTSAGGADGQRVD